MKFYNNQVARHLLNVPLEFLLEKLKDTLDETGSNKIERKDLTSFLLDYIPICRMEIPKTEEYPKLTKADINEVIQELLSQHYLTFSDENPNPKTELYFMIGTFANSHHQNI